MDLTTKALKGICPSAQLRTEHGCDAVYCETAKGKNPPNSAVYFQIRGGGVCIATDFFPTGHSNYDSDVDTGRMEKCPYNPEK